jgi:pimeloyl-ACP methyl ester carboxylesterase
MIETRRITTAPGLTFDTSVAGDEKAPLVLMLHGFCVSRYLWDAQVQALGDAGFYAVAPNQRGYAAEARPDPADFSNYEVDKLIGDAMDIVAAVGGPECRFHLVGHDWGGSISWFIADRYPERLASLTMLSRPHPASFAHAMQADPEQPTRSAHHVWLKDPDAGAKLLADNAAWYRGRLRKNGVPDVAIDRHMSVIGSPPATEAALAWYRARGDRKALAPTRVPTLFIWGDADDTVGRMAAEGTAAFIDAPYQFEVMPGVGHYAADQMPERVTALLLAHLARHPL